MTHGFDAPYWQQHWDDRTTSMSSAPAHPHLAAELADLTPGRALDAGCGAGAEAIWLADQGWQVTGVDVSAEALARAARRPGGDRVTWVEADLTTWRPDGDLDLVVTAYAHSTLPQLELYDRLAGWVAPGGTLLLVGHGHAQAGAHAHGHAHGDGPPPEASVTADDVAARLDTAEWEVVTAQQQQRSLPGPDGREVHLHDVVVRAVRRSRPGAATGSRGTTRPAAGSTDRA